MIAHIYLTKVLKVPHQIKSTLLRTRLLTVIEFTEINVTATIVFLDCGLNQIQVDINKCDWETLSNHLI